jgi:hypothetical protein
MDKVARRIQGEAMNISSKRQLAGLALLTALGGCAAAPAVQPPPATPAVVRSPTIKGQENVLGRDAGTLIGQFGQPDLDVREGSARKLQFAGPVCVLDAYLYPRAGGGEPVVTHVDARLPDGRDIDRASCIAALSRREQAR